jgi:hypothetical protein
MWLSVGMWAKASISPFSAPFLAGEAQPFGLLPDRPSYPRAILGVLALLQKRGPVLLLCIQLIHKT